MFSNLSDELMSSNGLCSCKDGFICFTHCQTSPCESVTTDDPCEGVKEAKATSTSTFKTGLPRLSFRSSEPLSDFDSTLLHFVFSCQPDLTTLFYHLHYSSPGSKLAERPSVQYCRRPFLYPGSLVHPVVAVSGRFIHSFKGILSAVP